MIPEEGCFGQPKYNTFYVVSALAFTTQNNLSIVRLCRYLRFGKLTICFLYKK